MKVNKSGVEKNTILQPFAVNSSNVPTELLQLRLQLSTEIRKADSGISIIFFLRQQEHGKPHLNLRFSSNLRFVFVLFF